MMCKRDAKLSVLFCVLDIQENDLNEFEKYAIFNFDNRGFLLMLIGMKNKT